MTLIDKENDKRSFVPDLISVNEAARRVGVHTDTLYRLCRTGQFPPAIQIGARWRVSVPRLDGICMGTQVWLLTPSERDLPSVHVSR
jgi:excisionase family DNA binding protein